MTESEIQLPKISIPLNALRDLLAGLYEAVAELRLPDDMVITADSLGAALCQVAGFHPEPVVALYLQSEIASLER
jgi:hypothetical protein